ncbi:conserved hypothetical protein [Pyrenophora tritici-repentis Pt-1C-BFP]|uniref:Uncharacterized protein n=1 Tax=Pyrenophora tritici-repentis (strain Pt-1C-BFP) TaxID=426418 RepID=B2W6N2_PYRTR|nr:uncharacterized protein PTRG_05470 [Pyrenophora tritici-repentis Pt-1C-BFP]EDU48390.1 conserved hypothetical protein [Pyrenophora tritici-repentis Pt-1C-BFP]
MSLNGLDSVEVTQAYQGALAEAGGWFLLRYTSRDAVEVLTRGTGGAGEARAAVAQYEEKSPLYGLLLYRRRKVLVKYVPEGTSRLLQARVAVHFINIAEKFAPHDIVLPITTPDELSDAALTSACSLHTAAPSSSSSSSSSRQQKLSWIQEAAEEVGGDESLTRPSTAKSTIPTILEPQTEEPVPSLPSSSHGESVPLILDDKAVEHKLSSQISHVTMETVSEGPVTPETDLSDLHDTLKSYDSLFENGPEPRNSSQTTRPNYDELYEHYYAQYTKPKVKLGPRPRPSLDGKRPATSGSAPADLSRPKSSLPAGLRSANRKAAESKMSKSTTPGALPTISIPPATQDLNPPSMPQSPVSSLYSTRGPISVKSMPVSSYRSLNRSTGPTQERTRLMKALELRKKQQQQQKDKIPEVQTEDAEATDDEAEVKTIVTPESEETAEEESSPERETLLGDDLQFAHRLSSSGLTATENQAEADDLNSSFSISSPVSAQTRGSSDAPSTRPSSISEDEAGMEDSQKCEDAHNPDIDERQSVDSQPTVVPESTTPVPGEAPSQQTEGPVITERAPSFDDTEGEAREVPRPAEENVRRSNRESTIYMPSGDTEDGQAKKRNRESMLMPSSKRRSFGESKKGKRRALLDAVNVSAENSEAEYLSDDSFMEELQSATVHEAKPMSVSKSPITPFFPRKSSHTDLSTPPRSASSNYAESTPLELHQSPLIIDHQVATFTPMSPPRGRTEPTSPREVRSSHSREQSIAASRTSSESTWRNFGRRMSESKSVHSQEGDEKRSEKKEKKESHSGKKSSKTSKMFKRMSSSISSMPWKNSSSNLASSENDMRSTSLASLREPPPAVHVGDLNIQFPDTLLWKRRWVEIDGSGNLVLSPSKHNEKGVTKRFHLSDFRTPYPPDQDRQELPNSVVLDFIDGRTLQCACETYIGQAQVLQILREAHDAWLAYNQTQ